MKILVINCGSSSVKYKLLDMRSENDYDIVCKGNVEKIGLCPEFPDHTAAIGKVLSDIGDLSGIAAVGHRIVQGADYFDRSVEVDEDVIAKIDKCSDMAPLHNPAHILGIRAISKMLPGVRQVVVFDTAFHQTMAPEAYMYALPYEYYTNYRVRRYGAHGTSHRYVSAEGARFAGIPLGHSRIITCHIGNGSSVTAIRDGKCIDTSMGFTPLEGMIMGTRCGCIDASIVPYIMKKENMSPDEASEMLNRKSGFLGLSGKSSDFRDIRHLALSGDKRAALVYDKLILDITKLVGGFVAELGGLDLLIFTAGIAEHNPCIRQDVCSNLGYLGVRIDASANEAADGPTLISAPDSALKVAMIPTDEELVIARDTMNICK